MLVSLPHSGLAGTSVVQSWCATVQRLASGEWPSSTDIAVGGILMLPAFIEGEQERYGLLSAYHALHWSAQVWCRVGAQPFV